MRVAPQSFPYLAVSCALLLSACGPSQAPATKVEPVQASAPISVAAPAGQYQVDLNHADLSFAVTHLGLAPYIARFKRYQAELKLTPEDWSQSAITITLDPTSVITGYASDYKATHKDSAFDSWEEDLARSERFLMADEYPQVSYRSTSVSQTPDGKLRIEGELTLRGQTHPLNMLATVTGSTEAHPFTKRGAIGFSASGSFNRSDFGMNFMQGPGLLGDEVSVRFTGEFQQAAK